MAFTPSVENLHDHIINTDGQEYSIPVPSVGSAEGGVGADSQELISRRVATLAVMSIQRLCYRDTDYSRALQVKCHACVGGTSVREDTRILQAGVHVVVGTPGRVYDMLRRRALRADSIRMFVLDEADEMLSRGFKDQIYDIFQLLPPKLQVWDSPVGT